MKKEKALNILKIVLAAAIVLTAILNYNRLSNLDVRALIDGASSLLVAELIIIGIYALKSVLFVIPASLIYLSVGLAMETWRAVLVNMLGIAVEITITFLLGKFLGKSAVEKKIKGTKMGDKMLNMQDKNKNLAILGIRFIPAFPIDFSSLFMGAFDFKFLPYFFFSLLGLAPRVIGFTIIGDAIYDLIPMKYIVLIAVIAVPAALIAMVLKKKFGKNDGADKPGTEA